MANFLPISNSRECQLTECLNSSRKIKHINALLDLNKLMEREGWGEEKSPLEIEAVKTYEDFFFIFYF